jgi:hypothetical protein
VKSCLDEVKGGAAGRAFGWIAALRRTLQCKKVVPKI